MVRRIGAASARLVIDFCDRYIALIVISIEIPIPRYSYTKKQGWGGNRYFMHVAFSRSLI